MNGRRITIRGLGIVIISAVLVGILGVEHQIGKAASAAAETPAITSETVVLFEDDFSDPNWGFSDVEAENYRAWHQDGEFHVRRTAGDPAYVKLTGLVVSDFAVEVDARVIEGPEEAASYGFAYRGTAGFGPDYYRWQVSTDGTFNVQGNIEGGDSDDLEWYSRDFGTEGGWFNTPFIWRGYDKTNHLKLECRGSEMSFYVNDKLVLQAVDSRLLEGEISLVTVADGEVETVFDNFRIYELDASQGSQPRDDFKVLFEEDFEVEHAGWQDWDQSATDQDTRSIEDGAYKLLAIEPNAKVWGGHPELGTIADFILDVDMSMLSDSQESAYGVYFGYVDDENFTTFIISAKQQFYFGSKVAGNWTIFNDWDESSLINAGAGTNHLIIEAQGSEIFVYVNGELLAQVDNSPSIEGDIKPYLQAAQSESNVPVAFDNMVVLVPEAEGQTPTPTSTFTPSPTPEPTYTPTSAVAMVKVSTNTNCRVGPGIPYTLLGALLVGEEAEIIARDPTSKYWYIKNPDGDGFCWMWGYYATATGNTNALPVFTPMPTPTSTPTPTPAVGFSVVFNEVDSCVGWEIEFKITNTGDVMFQSVSTVVTDVDVPQTVNTSAEVFEERIGGLVGISYNDLDPGDTGYTVGGVLVNDPAGHDIDATVKLCTEPGLTGTCVAKSLSFPVP